jgi:hypothetical protein
MIVTRNGRRQHLRLRSPVCACRRLERGPTARKGAAHAWAAYKQRAAIIAFRPENRKI